MDLFTAVQSGNADDVRDLLARDPSLATARNQQGISALMLAVYMRRTEIANLLQSAHPALDIFEAAALGKTDSIAALIRQDRALANARSADGFTPLHLSCFFGQESAAHLLLKNGARPDAVANNSMKVMPLHSAAAGHSAANGGALPTARRQKRQTLPRLFGTAQPLSEQELLIHRETKIVGQQSHTASRLPVERGLQLNGGRESEDLLSKSGIVLPWGRYLRPEGSTHSREPRQMHRCFNFAQHDRGVG